MKYVSRVLVAAICVFGSASASQAGLINGSFEDLGSGSLNQGSGTSKWGLFTSIPGWTSATGGHPLEIGMATTYGVTGADGIHVLELDSTGNAAVSQALSLTAGATYTVSFLAALRAGVLPSSGSFDVYWNAEVLSFSPTSSVMATYSFNVVAQANNTLTFQGTGTGDKYGAIIDRVRVPDGGATVALLGLALGGLGFLRRRML